MKYTVKNHNRHYHYEGVFMRANEVELKGENAIEIIIEDKHSSDRVEVTIPLEELKQILKSHFKDVAVNLANQ